MATVSESRRFVPSVDRILKTEPIAAALMRYPRWAVLQETRGVLDEVRSGAIPIVAEDARDGWLNDLGEEIVRRVEVTAEYSLKTVINATGVVLHTNLGRALLSERALEHVVRVSRRYSNVELDLDSGERGSRYVHVESSIAELTGAEAALIVNNNAAAVLLCLSALAHGREVVISRGELVEIGGSFRIPSVMRQSGATLVEVGTTNRTHLEDYEAAIGDQTALLLKVHNSNFRIIGFTSSVPVSELARLAKNRGLLVVNDLGSGCLVDLRIFGLPHEPTVKEALFEGADLITFSGDKLLGGPQMGIIAGRADLVKRLKKHQLLRALRVDKMTLAAFEATLRIYRDPKTAIAEIPTLRMLALSAEEIRARATAFVAELTRRVPAVVAIAAKPGESEVGAGSAPEAGLATHLVAIRPAGVEVAEIEARLRRSRPPILVRVFAGEVLIDLRTVHEDEERALLEALARALASP
jgi:L-seryl-tRNA(Ser) seleniumtransferase